VGLVEASWYGGIHPDEGVLTEPLAEVVAAVAAASPLSVRERMLPRSVLRRARRHPAPHDDAAAPGGRGGGVDVSAGGTGERSGAIPARTGGGSAPPSGR